MKNDSWVSEERAEQEKRLVRFHPLPPRYPDDYEIANCGCVHHAEDGVPCQHDKLKTLP